MSVPQNPNEVVVHLTELSRQLADATTQINEADIAAVNAREAAKLAEAKAFLAAEGSVDARKSQAVVQTHDLRLAAEVAEATVRGLQRTIRTLQTRIDVGRTFGATLRSEMALGGTGVHGA
ncbi:hypothetical protein IU414_06385 [Nocardia farcinica]|uniref:hypothetical protein n=1 Tax=Nocardia farcinica TaxID=37329 RepID=UPI00189629AE|nr:hypothetical protein [Nocardia farcinica]MBF6254451.1 hypothetical protein [Nocardia farcinica]MBF6584386.1 hypothetical protein [Nocardia farcinica]